MNAADDRIFLKWEQVLSRLQIHADFNGWSTHSNCLRFSDKAISNLTLARSID